MTFLFLVAFISWPLIFGGLMLLLPKRWHLAQGLLLLVALLVNLQYTLILPGRDLSFSVPWGGFGFTFALRVYPFAAYVLFSAALLSLLVGVYSMAFLKGWEGSKFFYAYFLFTVACVNGAVLANDLLVLLFFWEGLLVLLYGMIYLGRPGGFRTAGKALIICGAADLCMMAGIAITAFLAKSTQISQISLPLGGGLASGAFLLLVTGALAKGGAMPFHSWIPDAADDAPLPFMALVPGALEKLLGIYFLCRVTLDFYRMDHHSTLSTVLMGVGALTIVLAVLMALIQQDYKRLLSFHAISQVGYMVLGIGSGTAAGIVGGVFHMINNALYKCGLFLTAGAVEKQTGNSDLKTLGGLARKMPLTCLGFTVAALSISGVPFFNGFFSKELVYEGALERGWIYYAAALLGSVLTAASFLKLGHAVFFDRPRGNISQVKEAPWMMLAPILAIAALCLFFGLANAVPLDAIVESLGAHRFGGHHFAGPPKLNLLTWLTLVALALALINHGWGVRKTGSGLQAVDHVHYAPGLHWVYDHAEMRYFDPYEIALRLVRLLARLAWSIDRGVDWFYDTAVVRVANFFAQELKREHSGAYVRYMAWSLLGALIMAALII